MKAIFKIEKLSLDFPTGSQTGHEVTDWRYWYHQTTYESSDLKKFIDLIENKYSDKYVTYQCGIGGTIGIKRKEL